MYHSGIGPTQLNNLLSSLKLPHISKSLIRRRCDEVGPVLENLADETAAKALEEEGRLSIVYFCLYSNIMALSPDIVLRKSVCQTHWSEKGFV